MGELRITFKGSFVKLAGETMFAKFFCRGNKMEARLDYPARDCSHASAVKRAIHTLQCLVLPAALKLDIATAIKGSYPPGHAFDEDVAKGLQKHRLAVKKAEAEKKG